MKELWRELSLFRRILVLALAAMILGFGIATPLMTARKGFAYEDTLLYQTEEEGVRRYTGRLDGKQASFAVTEDGLVEYRWGEKVYGPYQVVEDPAAAPEESMTGLEIRRGKQVLFRGGFSGGEWSMLYDENGEPFQFMDITYSTGDGKVYDADGRELTTYDLHEPRLSVLARLVLKEPPLSSRGSVGLYLLVTVLAAFNLFQILFPRLVFRWSLWGRVRDPERAEPSDLYLAAEQIEWVALTGLIAWFYWMALTVIR